MTVTKIKKALIPVAGLGTRMLPATKAIPKELLPIYDKPIIQYVVEEAIEAGINEIIFITRSGKEAIENHFDRNFELEQTFQKKIDKQNSKKLKTISFPNLKISSVRQEAPIGLGDAIYCAKELVRKKESFAVLLPDEFLFSKPIGIDLKKIISNFNKTGMPQLLVEKIPKSLVSSYGIVKYKKNNSNIVSELIEKPNPKRCSLRQRIVGRYILPYEIFDHIANLKHQKNKEIQLTDAINLLINDKKKSVNSVISKSKIYDCGSKKGFIGANLELSLKEKGMKKYLQEIIMR
tara:strand:+ start:1497 stop:2372 length:876 start_codon:yes stop_codon:yes gene_type:complete